MRTKVSTIGVVWQHCAARPKGVDAAACVLPVGIISPRDTGRRATAAGAAGPPIGIRIRKEEATVRQ
jgi:hypothetical protein